MQVRWVGRYAALLQQAAPTPYLVFLSPPFGGPSALGHIRVVERDEPSRPRAQEHLVALRSATVQIDCHVRRTQGVSQRLERLCRTDGVYGAGQHRQRLQGLGGRQDASMIRKRGRQPSHGWHGGQQVAHAKGPQHHEEGRATAAPPCRQGQEDSTEGVTTSSRTSHPRGWRSAKRTAEATSSGLFSTASGAGL